MDDPSQRVSLAPPSGEVMSYLLFVCLLAGLHTNDPADVVGDETGTE